MTQVKALAVDASLATCPTTLPQDLINAYQMTTTFAQAHARTVNSDPSSSAYFEAMSQEQMKLGWNVVTAEKVKLDQQAGKIQPASIVESVLNPYLTPEQQAATAGLLNAIKQPSAGVTNFVTFFHNKSKSSGSKHAMAMGVLEEMNNSVAVKMMYYGFDFDATAERWLFVEVDSASLSVEAYHLEMNLNLELYTSTVKKAIADKLAGKEKDHIADTSLDL